ncbi:MAG: ABC transporter substrate-binding protein [Candidatus Rokubacteria bacterium]|nr:ABC transporter substrate-binding protein [Candidatus Rokubacteria bacterium]
MMTAYRPFGPVLLAALLALAPASPLAAQETPRPGGILKAAMIGEPPSLDVHWTTAVITQEIAFHIYETLYTYDKTLTPTPMLAESHQVSDGGRRYTIALRKGVKFHTGKEMTSADVVPSLQRWGKMATSGKALWKGVEAVEAKDPYAVVIHLKEPSGSLLYGLAGPNNAAAIYPAEVITAAGEGQVKEYIGTGPYRFVEHKPDRHIKVARFKDYAARSESPDGGWGGKRNAYVDEILFLPVPDVSVRLAGIETGEYHFAQGIKQDQYDRAKAMPAVEPGVLRPYGWNTAVPNHKQGVMANKKVRQAFQAVLDMEPIMAAAVGNKTFYRLQGALFYPEQALFHTDAGVSAYNQKNKDKARKLLQEAGYKGEPVRWITTKEYEWMFDSALVAKQQMEEVGFKVDLQVVDWATLVQRRNKPELYDVFSTGFTLSADPALATSIQCNWPGWWCHEEKDRLLAEMARETDPKKRKALIERVQSIFYEDVGRIKFGDYFPLTLTRKELRGYRATPYTHFWNAWLAK